MRIKFCADALARVSLRLRGDQNTPFLWSAQLQLEQAQLSLPSFELPIRIERGEANISDGNIQFSNVVGTSDGLDRLFGKGSTNIDGFPVTTDFELLFRNMDLATIRKLVRGLPEELDGRIEGTVAGKASVEQSRQTTVELTAASRSASLDYGAIHAKNSTVQVEVQHLILDKNQIVEKLDGSVVVNALLENQSADEVFETFNLQDLQRQLSIEAEASGDVRFELPVATAEKIETWQLNVSARAPSGRFSQQDVRDVRAEVELVGGNLRFTEITAQPVRHATETEALPHNLVGNGSFAQLDVSLDWPLVSTAEHEEFGLLNVAGQQVPLKWMIGFLENQMQNAQNAPSAESQSDLEKSLDRLGGAVDFEACFFLDSKQPDLLEKWSGEGRLSNSTISAAPHRLESVNAAFSLLAGRLAVSDFAGSFPAGGRLSGLGQINVTNGKIESAEIAAADMPLPWLVKVAAQVDAGIANLLSRARIETDAEGDQLDGVLSAQFLLQNNGVGVLPWTVKTHVNSQQLKILGQQLNQVTLDGQFDAGQILIQNVHAELPNRGMFDFAGTWNLEEESGNSDLEWKKLPLAWLAKLGVPTSIPIAGTTSGKLRLSSKERSVDGSAIPIAVEGSMSATGLAMGDLVTREIQLEIRTDGDSVLLERFRADGDLAGLDLQGAIDLREPFKFSSRGTIQSLPLARIFQHRSVVRDFGDITNVTGLLEANLDLRGEFVDFDWSTSGTATIRKPRIEGKLHSDISANWEYNADDIASARGFISAFGGKIEMVELSQVPQRLKFEFSELDATELSELTRLEVPLSGKLSGDVSLNEWKLEETRWADLQLQGTAFLLGNAEIGELNGAAEFRDQQLKYSLAGSFLGGKFNCEGKTDVAGVDLRKSEFPLQVEFANASLGRLYGLSSALTDLRRLTGSLSAKAEFSFGLDRLPTGDGTIKIDSLKWSNKLLTREVSTDIKLAASTLQFDKLRVDLKRGEISGRATIPVSTNVRGTYELNCRQFDLQKFLDVVLDEGISGAGLLNARISGQIGRSISGRGTIGIERAEILGLTSEILQLPVEFSFQPQQKTGRVEFRRSRFQAYGGIVSGLATLDFGREFNLKTDLRVSHLATERLLAALAGFDNAGQGDLSGHLVLRGNSIRSWRELRGSFAGTLDQAQAFKLPLLDEVARFLGGNQIQSRDFESDELELLLNHGRIEIKKLNFSNSLARIAITGSARD